MRYCCLIVILVGAVAISPHLSRGQEPPKPKAPVVFEEVPPGVSKITWVHDNGRSEARHCPRPVVAAGLFSTSTTTVGWIIYLVNSGPSDFYTPKDQPIRNALISEQPHGSFTDVTEKSRRGVRPDGQFRMGAAASDYDGDGW